MLDAETVQRGAALVEQVLAWILFESDSALKNGEAREHIRALFGAQVDAALAERFGKQSGAQ